MSIEIKDIVSLTGSPGLHKVIKADDRAIIVESLDDKQRRQMIKGNMMVSKLIDVSIYTKDDSEPLVTVLQAVAEKYGAELPVSKKSKNEDLMQFLSSVLPDLDEERVYPSNVKKLISWYKILQDFEVSLEWNKEEEDQKTEEKQDENQPEVETSSE